jgi:hypothetical protein
VDAEEESREGIGVREGHIIVVVEGKVGRRDRYDTSSPPPPLSPLNIMKQST